MASSMRFALVLVALIVAVNGSSESETALAGKNPVRKVVTMLQGMQNKVKAEGEEAAELHAKFMCYCKSGASALEDSIAAAGDKTVELEASIKATVEKLAQTKATLGAAQADRTAAKAAMSEATAMRKKEAASFAAERDEYDANISALTKAVAAVEQGMAGSFLQTPIAQTLKRVVSGSQTAKMTDYDRQELLSFLSGTARYAPAGGEVTGIMKQLNDEMNAGRKDIIAEENAAIKEYDDLMGAKTKEVKALTKAIERKLEKSGDLGVKIAEMKNDLGDTGEALVEDKKFLADMKKSCGSAAENYEADAKIRNEELAALADTIKILNDDDALELFKKTLPGASSLLELQVSARATRERALQAVSSAQKKANKQDKPMLDFIALSLRGKKIGFDKVVKMIEDMVATLKQEQADDNDKKEYCEEQFDSSDDKKKSLEKSYKDTMTSIADTEEGIKTTKEEIAGLLAGIKALDKSVAEATANRKAENAEYKDLMASNGAAKELLLFAKNRLQKFYNPKLYKPPAKEELSAEDRIVSNVGSLVQISAHRNIAAPPPAPATAAAYKKKSGESGGVLAMIDLLVADLDKEMQVAKTTETDAQGDYQEFLADSQEKRTKDSKSLTDKEAALGTMEGELLASKDAKKSTAKELSSTMQYISNLHAECDWLIQYFDVRFQARTGEIDALGKAKAVLSGADFSLAQMGSSRRFLQRA